MESNPYALDDIYYIPSPDNITGQHKRCGDSLYSENNKFNKRNLPGNSNNFEQLINKINRINNKRKIQPK